MKVSPSVSFAPANLVVHTMVEASVNNRAVLIEAESEDFYRSSRAALVNRRSRVDDQESTSTR
jgi:hypothetical protein